ncbi:WD repeat-containing protein 81 [Sitophilus oryzae]|uniref:WD repeat-containing protein 81 n=1 Tax=Sitophilus oryzae TaxID=7048 RepID=A0A6J2YKR1_SITOR|nr:WD repeat-containing protein 81 [Sitophilus oryzae]
MENLFEEIGIPPKYLKKSAKDDRFVALVHKQWLKSLVKHSKLIDFIEKPKLEAWHCIEDTNSLWIKVFVSVFKKKDAKVIPLPRIRPNLAKDDNPLLFVQFLQYISHSNYKNLWKDAYKKYNGNIDINKDTQVTLVDYNHVLREIILRIYGCSIVNTLDSSLSIEHSKVFDVNLNVLPACCGVETMNAIFLLHIPFIEHNLLDGVTFSPAILDKCYSKPLFIIYQLINLLKSLHDRSLTLGDITLNDIYFSEDLWIYVFPQITSNIYVQDLTNFEPRHPTFRDCRKFGHKFDSSLMRCFYCQLKTYDKVQICEESLEEICQLWIEGKISNFTYISALNKFSGRKLGDPNCHYVFPWVSDFSSACGKNWRDLKKSKYRLNKGDRQLDLTYDHSQAQVPHHVSDVLSSITYYVYMARRTPKSVLCKNVRTVWVPAEYPSSIQRMQEWTPDECIPEFFSDPSVFRSIHDDLEDLEVPLWSSGPEDFVERHREALESAYVSERLHHWIDLTFGYKLSGIPAIKAKNVCLHLADDHTYLTKSGIVQLFSRPHPPKAIPSPFWSKNPPKFYNTTPSKSVHQRSRDKSTSASTSEVNRSDEEVVEYATYNTPTLSSIHIKEYTEHLDSNMAGTSNWSPLGLSKISSRSRSSLHEEQFSGTKPNRSPSATRSSSVGPKNPTFMSHVSQRTKPGSGSSTLNTGIINLPKEYKPEQALESLEKQYAFLSRTFHVESAKKYNFSEDTQKNQEKNTEECLVQNAFTNFIYTENFEEKFRVKSKATKSYTFPMDNFNLERRGTTVKKSEHQILCNYSNIVTSRKTRELQILGCLIVEIFMPKQLRSSGSTNTDCFFSQRLKSCLTIIRSCPNDIPPCISYLVNLLLQPHIVNPQNFSYPVVTDLGLPPPTTHLLLEPLLQSGVPFPRGFPDVYRILASLKEFKNVALELDVLYYFDCDGTACWEYENLERTKILLAQNISECKVKKCTKDLESFLEDIDTNTQSEVINILLPHAKGLIEDPPTSVLAAWYLFDPMSRVLGTKLSAKTLLDSVLKLYEQEPSETSPYNGKIAKIYHHSFLLRLMVRLGLKCFLENFVTPLVEAVGGYKDFEKLDFPFHTHSEKILKKTSHLKNMDSMSNESSPTSSDKPVKVQNDAELKKDEDIFELDEEKDSENQMKSLIEHLELNITSDLPFNVSAAEEALDATLSENMDQLRSLEVRLGPVLMSRYLSRNLLRMLTLCYVGKENLTSVNPENGANCKEEVTEFSITSSKVVGDDNACKVLHCLANIAGLYGEKLILFQYLPHMTELVALCKKRLTQTLEGGLISCFALLKHIVPYLSDATLMDQLQEILTGIVQPAESLLGSTELLFPSGRTARNALARKFVDALYVLAVRIGADMTRKYLAVPSVQKFFLIFDKVYGRNNEMSTDTGCYRATPESYGSIELSSTVKAVPVPHVRLKDSESFDSVSPTHTSNIGEENVQALAMEELRDVFTLELAYRTYIPFLKHVGINSLEISLKNHDRIRDLCKNYEQNAKTSLEGSKMILSDINWSQSIPPSSSIGSNINLIGNRIDVQAETSEPPKANDLLSLVSNRMENNARHLKGNWFSYWAHEIGRPEKDNSFNFNQIKLQTFVGHTNSVKCLYILDNENSFMSGSRDKTVKLWSLRSQGDGSSTSNCQWTYTAHKKSILSLTFVESTRLVVSCDSVVHLWDPFMGTVLNQLESPKFSPVNVVKSMPSPSSLVFSATTEGTIKVIDTRLANYVYDLKVTVNPSGLIRCLAIGPSGSWIAAGQSSGSITVLDTRKGLVVSSWRAHEGEVLQMVAPNDDTLISSSLDQTISVWNVNDGRFKHHMSTICVPRGATEPAHCLCVYEGNELVSGTTANRVGVHTDISPRAAYSSTKLRGDTFKGLLTSMGMLPLNRLLLLGADNGHISLLC